VRNGSATVSAFLTHAFPIFNINSL